MSHSNQETTKMGTKTSAQSFLKKFTKRAIMGEFRGLEPKSFENGLQYMVWICSKDPKDFKMCQETSQTSSTKIYKKMTTKITEKEKIGGRKG